MEQRTWWGWWRGTVHLRPSRVFALLTFTGSTNRTALTSFPLSGCQVIVALDWPGGPKPQKESARASAGRKASAATSTEAPRWDRVIRMSCLQDYGDGQ